MQLFPLISTLGHIIIFCFISLSERKATLHFILMEYIRFLWGVFLHSFTTNNLLLSQVTGLIIDKRKVICFSGVVCIAETAGLTLLKERSHPNCFNAAVQLALNYFGPGLREKASLGLSTGQSGSDSLTSKLPAACARAIVPGRC